jgi:hypothetical protein
MQCFWPQFQNFSLRGWIKYSAFGDTSKILATKYSAYDRNSKILAARLNKIQRFWSQFLNFSLRGWTTCSQPELF